MPWLPPSPPPPREKPFFHTPPACPFLHAHYGKLLSCFLLLEHNLLNSSHVSPYPPPCLRTPIQAKALEGPPPRLLKPSFHSHKFTHSFSPPHIGFFYVCISVQTHKYYIGRASGLQAGVGRLVIKDENLTTRA